MKHLKKDFMLPLTVLGIIVGGIITDGVLAETLDYSNDISIESTSHIERKASDFSIDTRRKEPILIADATVVEEIKMDSTPTPEPTIEPTIEVTPEPTPEISPDEIFEEVSEPVVEEVVYTEEVCSDYVEAPAVEYGTYHEDIGMTYVGTLSVTWYNRDYYGYDAEGCWHHITGHNLIPFSSCALPPEYAYLAGRTVYVDGFGYWEVCDESPTGICDLYVMHESDGDPRGMIPGVDIYVVN